MYAIAMSHIRCRLQPSPELPHAETVLVGKDIWDALTPQNDERRIAVLIRPLEADAPKKNVTKPLLCWAMCENSQV